MYVERPTLIPSTVRWQGRSPVAPRVLPDGCTDLIWTGDGLLVAGPDTVAHTSPVMPGRLLVALRFGPGVGPAVFAVPMAELRDQRVDLGQLAPAPVVRRIGDRLAEVTDRGDPGDVLEQEVRRFMAPPAPITLAIADLLAHGRPVAAVADTVGLSARQLQRRSLEAFGYGPKLLARILR
ncbi:MAG: DUF6597 domain-containing transcriptional factor, partial [Ilumatobacteraceae bacterium]